MPSAVPYGRDRSIELNARRGRVDIDSDVDTTYTMKLTDMLVVVDEATPTTGAAVTITLPNVNEAAGLNFSVRAPRGGTNTVTVQDADESVDWSNASLNADEDSLVVWSDGSKWNVISDDYT